MYGAGFGEDRGSGACSVIAWGPESWGRQWLSSWTWLGFWKACSAPSWSRPGHRPHCFLKYLNKQTASLKGQSQRHRFLSGCWLGSRLDSRPGSQGDWLTFWGLEFKNKAAALAEMSGSEPNTVWPWANQSLSRPRSPHLHREAKTFPGSVFT